MESKYAVTNKTPLKTNGINGFPVKRKFTTTNEDQKNLIKKRILGNNNNAMASPASNGNVKVQSIDEQRKQLPVYQCRQRLMQEIRKADTVLLMGETGSGKTTQIPQFMLDAGYAQKGMIGVTQPRRVAAITIAKRVAQEQHCRSGETVGYTVRFEDCTSPQTKIRFMTDGSLLREALSDRLLKQYSVLMLDEAHERTVNTDVLFGIVKEAQRQRRLLNLTPLKVIVTSATMDIDHFGEYFGVRGMYLEGRTYPVRVMHAKDTQPDYLHAVLVTIFDVHRNLPIDHDILVFLTGQEEIESMAQQIRHIAKSNSADLQPVRVFTLYAQLQQSKQLDCFLPTPANARKIILSTNIAETSVTIPGVRCVIDCGYVKRRIYSPNSGLDILRVVPISQAQSWQRCGRAGRDAPGICYRTYTQAQMSAFENMPKPEILRSNISSTVLQLLAMGIDCRTFDFIDRPPASVIDYAYKQLEALGAIVNSVAAPELTDLGRQMSQFPLDPRYSKLLMAAPELNCMEEMLSLVAVLSGENVFITHAEKRELAALAHAKYQSKHGDHLTLLNVFTAFQKTEKIKLWCHDNFLNTRNLLYAREVRKQLLEIVERLELPVNSCGNNFEQVRKCLLTGLYDNIAELQRDNFYMAVTSRRRAKIHPSSVFHGNYRPPYIVFTEMVLTERNFLRQVTEIDPEWVADIVPNYAQLNKIKVSMANL